MNLLIQTSQDLYERVKLKLCVRVNNFIHMCVPKQTITFLYMYKLYLQTCVCKMTVYKFTGMCVNKMSRYVCVKVNL